MPIPNAILVSACLLGLNTRYDGELKRNQRVIDYLKNRNLVPIPVCPEQLGGLPTPRAASWFLQGDGGAVLDGTPCVVNAEGASMDAPFLRGAIETMKICRMLACEDAILKERSPSCGVHQIQRGDQMVEGSGVTCALLQRNGIRVLSEEDL